ncbi:MAG: AMP-binding protein, partial [Myxococcales bacterium]|nr:AMP-binding protein [Myxococcales bacterium]
MGKRHTLVHQLADWAERRPDQPAIHGKDSSGSWKSYTWKEYYHTVRRVGRGLIALGAEHAECVAIVGDNRTEWVLSQFGMMGVGCVPAPIYPTNTPEQVAHILTNSEAKIAICDGAVQLEKFLEIHNSGMAKLTKIVTMDPIASDAEMVISFEQLLELGDGVVDAEFDARLEAIDPDETGLLIYTSGTTGVSKGVQLTNKGLVLIGKALVDRFPEFREPGRYVVISYLPLCHAAEQLFTNLMHLDTGGQCYFCGDLKQIKDFLTEVRPTVFLGVPRVWEKFEAALRSKLALATGIKAKLASWAMRTELEQFKRSVDAGEEIGSFKRRVANKLVIGKVKAALGLDRLIVAATGAAPISVATQEFFASLGICIYEGYGMSETTGVATVTRPKKPRFGTVGTPLDGVEVKIGDDGEILLKGETMTRGYLRMPEETEELLDDEGWLHTGDLG